MRSFNKVKLFLFLLVFLSSFYFLIFNVVSADVIGQTVQFNIDPKFEYLGRDKVSATLRKISVTAYLYVSDDYWAGISEPERNLFLTKLDELAQEFDNRIYPIERAFWGLEPNPGIDNDPKIIILFTKLKDPAGGYFDTSHLYKKTEVQNSNEREMFFVSADSVVGGKAKIFLAHEFQHLIGFNQKEFLRKATEDTWLNELRSEYSIKIVGYDDDYNNSNLRRRVFAFSQSPSEPLAEWKNLSPDYGVITLFAYYLADHYGDKILIDSLRSSKIGIESINETLRLNGFSEIFSDVFTNWTMANILNDSSVASGKFAYKTAHLKDFKISSTQSSSTSGLGSNLSLSNSVKDWQPVWYEFTTPIGLEGNLKLYFSGPTGSKFLIPYIVFYVNGQKEIGFMSLSGGSGVNFIKGFGSDVYKVVVIPANQSKTSDFTDNDPVAAFTIQAQIVSEVPENIVTPVPTPTLLNLAGQSIQVILDQIRSLQEELLRLQGQQISQPPMQPSLPRDLFVGLRGNDVSWLQEFLISQGVYPEARVTGYFGPFTRSAVIRFQQKYGIFPQIGYVGAKTRAKIQELIQ